MKKSILSLLVIIFAILMAHGSTIGSWKAYMAYHDIMDVKKGGNTIYVLASNGLYTYSTVDNSLFMYDKINGLNDCLIEKIQWCQAAKVLIIVYDNYNIDILYSDGSIVNISEYMNKSMLYKKTIYSIDVYGNFAYLSTDFGIIKINVEKAEISDTYTLGFRVDYCHIEGNKIYAESSINGAYSANINDNLLDPASWTYTKPFEFRPYVIDQELLEKAKTLNPGGPKYNYFGFLKFANNQLYSCGEVIGGFRNACIQILKDDEWTIYQDEGIEEITGVGYKDLVVLDYDPKDIKHVFAGGRNGLYEFYDGKFQNYFDYKFTPIEIFDGKSIEYQLITGVKFDKEGNLWILNSQAPTQSIIEFTAERQWISHSKSELMILDADGFKNKSIGNMKRMMIDSRNLLWFVNDNSWNPFFYCYQFETDAIKGYTSFFNQDGTKLSPTNIRTIVEDHNNNIWVGTDIGPFYLSPKQIFEEQPVYTQVKVPRNDGTNYADYLLSGIDILSMAIDPAGRKWFGTNGNGVYLISADNMQQLDHFTTSNSGLLSNIVQDIAINDKTGEVFFGTDKGLCSYMGNATATNADMDKDNVYAYPNPVKPDYTGPINIVGLSLDADIKITTSNGILVASGRSNGGMFSWDGCDMKGKRVASGIYMVQTATSDGSKGTVCKIAIIN